MLLRRVAAKDRKAFEVLYGIYYRRLFAYLLKLTRRADLVEEVLNDVMFVVWRKADSFNGRSRPSTWIFGIAYHKALKALAKRSSDPPQAGWSATGGGTGEVGEAGEREPVDLDEPESMVSRRELAGTLSRALHELSPEQRAVVELTYYHGRSYQEIAETVGCPVNTVKTRMFHARRRLRDVLQQMGISGPA